MTQASSSVVRWGSYFRFFQYTRSELRWSIQSVLFPRCRYISRNHFLPVRGKFRRKPFLSFGKKFCKPVCVFFIRRLLSVVSLAVEVDILLGMLLATFTTSCPSSAPPTWLCPAVLWVRVRCLFPSTFELRWLWVLLLCHGVFVQFRSIYIEISKARESPATTTLQV